MNNKNSQHIVLSSMLWRYGEKICIEVIHFAISIFIARLLAPHLYGVVALVTALNGIVLAISDGGLSGALVQKKHADDLDYSTVFYFKMLLSCVFFLLICLFAGNLASFYGNPELAPMICASSTVLIFNSIKSVPSAYAQKTFQFKSFFWSSLSGTVISGIVGITLAYTGFGVWALIISSLTDVIIDSLMIFVFIKWRPRLCFSFARLKVLLSFSWKMLIADIISSVYARSRQLIIGKVYSMEDLAFYNRGDGYANLLVVNINLALNNVLFPTMSSIQDDIQKLRSIARRSIKVGSYIIFPMLIGFALCAEPLVRLILTEKWVPCVPYIQIFCVANALMQIQTANIVAIMSTGRSGLLLKMEIIRKSVAIVVLIITVGLGVKAMAYGLIPLAIFDSIVDIIPNKKLIDYGLREQLSDILPIALISMLMGVCVYAMSWLPLGDTPMLLVKITVGIVSYIGLSVLFKIDSFGYVWGVLKGMKQKFQKHGNDDQM